MATERNTENLVLREMGIIPNDEMKYIYKTDSEGVPEYGYLYMQGDEELPGAISDILKEIGGKPTQQELADLSIITKGKGKAKPEFIITVPEDLDTIIVVECKKGTDKHKSKELNKPQTHAVDGVLYYAKHLKKSYNVIAIAVSGTNQVDLYADTYYWEKGAASPRELEKINKMILKPESYFRMLENANARPVKACDINLVRDLAEYIHDSVRDLGLDQQEKPLFVSGLIIGLQNEEFLNSYKNYKTYTSLTKQLTLAIETQLLESGIATSRIKYIVNTFELIFDRKEFENIDLQLDYSIKWYIDKMNQIVIPMMNENSGMDIMAEFYNEFIRYAGGDGKNLGIVLTPTHISDFMCEIAGVNKDTKVLDMCCGSGTFLVSALSKMFSETDIPEERENIRKNNLYGVETNQKLYTLAITNMIVRGDGKSHIYNGSCFDDDIKKNLKDENGNGIIDVGLFNPPYALDKKKGEKTVKDSKNEMSFILNILECIRKDGKLAVIVPLSSAIGTKWKKERQQLLNNHTLEAVLTMPEDLFEKASAPACIMLITAHRAHDSRVKTFFGCFKDDGHETVKNKGRRDVNGEWNQIKENWLSLLINKEVAPGLSATNCVTHKDEWLCEAYMQTDYSTLNENDFASTITNYIEFLTQGGDEIENISFV